MPDSQINFGETLPEDFGGSALTKIIATLGPASAGVVTIRKLIEAGVSVFRLNLSHGDLETHAQRVQEVRKAASDLGRPIGILADLPGPKIRVGKLPETGVELHIGQTVVIGTSAEVSPVTQSPEAAALTCTYSGLPGDVNEGHRVLINDGAVRLLAVSRTDDKLTCVVKQGGLVTTGKGINLPDSHLRIEALTSHDFECVEWAVKNDLDFIAMSFVRSADEIRVLNEELRRLHAKYGCAGAMRPIIAKIELPQAVANIESITAAADALMVARGDLGVEMDLPRVPAIQKKLLKIADEYGKPCIVATQMLESMISAASPTRAEVSDVANAILDGADALMLSAETSIGKYPVVTVEYVRRVAQYTERYLASLSAGASPPKKLIESRHRTAALAHGAWTIARDVDARFIVVWSQLGGGARYLSQTRFTIPILAITSDERVARQMQLYWSVTPVRMPLPDDLDHLTTLIDHYLIATEWAHEGDACIIMAGQPLGRPASTNRIAVHYLGNPETGFHEPTRSPSESGPPSVW
ncbi:MAG TPA: pyruvate kinase [Phycisphaerales bacterium]|nr:pyruvate kinase [Phycisphaerales bacterium]